MGCGSTFPKVGELECLALTFREVCQALLVPVFPLTHYIYSK
jgi:hypothetical protein